MQRRATLLTLVALLPAVTGQLSGQNTPNFDVRDHTLSSRIGGLVASRSAKIAAFLNNARSTAPGTRVVTSRYGLPKLMLRDGASLTAPSSRDAEEIARGFLRSHSDIIPLSPAEVNSLRLAVKDVTPNATFLAFNQTLDGIDVFNAHIKFTLTSAGEVVQTSAGEVMPGLNISTTPQLTQQDAIAAGSRALGAAVAHRPIPIYSELSIFPLDASSARLAYRIFLDAGPTTFYEMLIDAENGALLYRHNLYLRAAQARVWTQSPLVGTRDLVTLPSGWLPAEAQLTTGNNVDAYLDRDGDDKPDSVTTSEMSNGRAFSATQFFDFAFGDGTVGLDPRRFQPASVTNLFYLVNAAHDYYYNLGFTEAAGNFQTDNFGRGGKGNDPVHAEAQQGNSDNNSGFIQTPDGISPTMRTGIFTMGTGSQTDDRDSAFDSQTVLHEYAHGVSSRLVGGRTSTSCLVGIQSDAMSEGWSDYFGSSYSNNPVFGVYIGGNATTGVRRQSYDNYTFTYEDIGNSDLSYEPHNDGEIWAATLWDLRKVLGQTITDKLVVSGLKSTPCGPSMTDARDGILSADQATNGGANRAKIWQVFARHGMGYSAYGQDGGYLTGTRYDAAYDQPPDLQALKNPSITSDPLIVPTAMGWAYAYTVKASNPNKGQLAFALTSGPAGMSIGAATGIMNWSATFTGHRVKITVTDGMGGKVVHGYFLPVVTPITAGAQVTIGGAAFSAGIATVVIPANTPVLQMTLRDGKGDSDLFVFDPTGALVALSGRDGSNETLSLAGPAAGMWYIQVDGYTDYSGVNLVAAPVTPALKNGNSTIPGLIGLAGSETFYRFTIPAGATSFTVSTSGGTGDVDLFLRKGSPAVCQPSQFVYEPCLYDYYSINAGNVEAISVTNPDPGDWYLDVSGFQDYHGVTLVTALAAPAKLAVSANALTFIGPEGGQAPAAQDLAISNPSGAVYTWTAQATVDSGAWLQISQQSGSGDTTLKVSVNPAGLRAGTYHGAITITSAGLAGSPQKLPVTLNVAALSAGSATLVFQAAGGDPPSQNLVIAIPGGDALKWTASATTSGSGNWLKITPSSGLGSGTVQVSVAAAGLSPGDYSGTITISAPGAANSPTQVRVSLTVAAAVTGPTISSIVNAAGFQPTISPGSWFAIQGARLSTTTRMWQLADFQDNTLPLSLDNVSVQVNGRDAAVYYVSLNQINALAPADDTTGPVTVTVKNNLGSVSSTANLQLFAPAFFTLDGSNVAAAHLDRVYVGAPGLLGDAVTTRPAVPGERIVMFGTGFGPTNPAVPTDQIFQGAAPLVDPTQLVLQIGSAQVTVEFAGIVSNGLYQFNVIVPDLASGSYPVVANIAGSATQTGVVITVGQ